ncbi:MAG: hypothetical protein ACLUI3_11350 [Christensenellales bacterium]
MKRYADAGGRLLVGDRLQRENFLIDNPIDRYCVNDRSAYRLNGTARWISPCRRSAGGSLQLAAPVSDGEFHLFMRIYLPDMNALDAWPRHPHSGMTDPQGGMIR